MALYAIGDVQGCYEALMRLLEKLHFDPAQDHLWFTGDLVNRGPDSVKVLRFVHQLGERAVTVLGNHDLHLLAIAAGCVQAKRRDTLKDVFEAADREPLMQWLRQQPLLHHDPERQLTLIHAGLAPQWDLPQARALAGEVEQALRGPDYVSFLAQMYGDQPDHWDDGLQGIDRLRVITNALTRLRYCDAQGLMQLQYKGAPEQAPPGMTPWFRVAQRRNAGHTVLFGHWSTLAAGAYPDNVIALDSGCLWGGSLTAVLLDASPWRFISQPCEPQQRP